MEDLKEKPKQKQFVVCWSKNRRATPMSVETTSIGKTTNRPMTTDTNNPEPIHGRELKDSRSQYVKKALNTQNADGFAEFKGGDAISYDDHQRARDMKTNKSGEHIAITQENGPPAP